MATVLCAVHDCSADRSSWPAVLQQHVSTLRRPLVLRRASPEAKQATEAASAEKGRAVDPILARLVAPPPPSPSRTDGPGRLPVRAFLSQSGYFHLDGRWKTSNGSAHPDGVLTACASSETTLGEFLSDDSSSSGWNSRYAVESIGGAGPGPEAAVRSVVEEYIGNEWKSALSSWGEGKSPAMRQIFAAAGKTQTQLHRDHFDNLFLCLSGDRRWRLAHPDCSGRVQLEEGSVSAAFKLPPPETPESGVDAGVDGKDFVYEGIPFVDLTVEAGDALFVPKGWWHDVAANSRGSPSSIAVNWYFDPPRGDSKS